VKPIEAGSVRIAITRVAGAEDVPLPLYATPGAAGADLHAAVDEPVTVRMGEVKAIRTGIMLAIPSGFEGQVRPRSGLALKAGLTLVNTPGTIDSDYRGEISVLVTCVTMKPCIIKRGDRIAQIIFAPVARAEFAEISELPQTARGERGFGHTGVRSAAAGV
jgi:dUTP pyrophosphatase